MRPIESTEAKSLHNSMNDLECPSKIEVLYWYSLVANCFQV